MKKFLFTAVFLSIIFAFNTKTEAAGPAGYYGSFYRELAPHGQWIEIDHGVAVWRPTIIRRNWAPYMDGQWIWTEDGWYWDSYEPFGYVTYHYGRWYYDDYYGWLWYPDYEWAPAWVEWRYSDDYIGWAPLPPYATFSINIGIHFTNNYDSPYGHWHFVKYKHFHHPHVIKYFAAPKVKYRIYNNSKYRTNYGYSSGRVVNRGVDVDIIRQRGGIKINERRIERVSDPKLVRERGGNDDRVRTFSVSRDEAMSRDFKGIDVKKSDRKSNLDISKVTIGDRRERNTEDRNIRVPEERKNGTTEIRKNTPEIRRSTPEVRNNNPEIRRSTPEARNNTPEIKRSTPEVRNNTPEIRRSTPEARNNTPEIKRSTPEVRNNTPEIKRSTPEARNNTPEIKRSTPEVRKNTPSVRPERKHEERRDNNVRTSPSRERTKEQSAPRNQRQPQNTETRSRGRN